MFITTALRQLRLRTRVNVIDNSKIAQQAKEARKPVRVIHVYRKGPKFPMGGMTDKVLVTIMGQMKKAYVVGCVQTQKAFVPRFDSNNVVLVDNNDVPLGTRITAPMPNILRSKGATTARIMAIATRFV